MYVNDKKGKTKLEKRTCKHCKLYHSTIETKKMHQRNKAEINQDDEEEDDGEPQQNEQEERERKQPPNAEK